MQDKNNETKMSIIIDGMDQVTLYIIIFVNCIKFVLAINEVTLQDSLRRRTREIWQCCVNSAYYCD